MLQVSPIAILIFICLISMKEEEWERKISLFHYNWQNKMEEVLEETYS